jgi:hypothetical protein
LNDYLNEINKMLMEQGENIQIIETIPIETNIKNYFDPIKIMELNILYINHLIIYSINIPLTENLDFNIYNIISLPVHVNKGNFIFIQSTHDYIIVEKNK